ncbi:hypothetical protein Slin15195_G045970 [Septoria linicola]|uniref:Uncharacterized protein n=1 Tax=Septoria linicola TaxID=215465 RepID=A0A9Q9AQJ9_9PEZI|nr:hypothetical protein Slin15195_G045970 [Septoria linicola]
MAWLALSEESKERISRSPLWLPPFDHLPGLIRLFSPLAQ